MTATFEALQNTVFRGEMPHFPEKLQEYWQVAILLRRKYLNRTSASDEIFGEIIEDMRAINEAYRYDDSLLNLLLEVYDDIARQLDPLHRDSRVRLLIEGIQDDYKTAKSDPDCTSQAR